MVKVQVLNSHVAIAAQEKTTVIRQADDVKVDVCTSNLFYNGDVTEDQLYMYV